MQDAVWSVGDLKGAWPELHTPREEFHLVTVWEACVFVRAVLRLVKLRRLYALSMDGS